jgi:hypothetical protein
MQVHRTSAEVTTAAVEEAVAAERSRINPVLVGASTPVQPSSNLYLEQVAARNVVPKTMVRAVLEVERGHVDAADRVVEAKADPVAVQNKGTSSQG